MEPHTFDDNSDRVPTFFLQYFGADPDPDAINNERSSLKYEIAKIMQIFKLEPISHPGLDRKALEWWIWIRQHDADPAVSFIQRGNSPQINSFK